MDPVSPLPAIASLLLAFATAFVLARLFGAPPEQGRFASIDGLRGYLAFLVFLHHSCIWYFYLRTGKWVVPPSNLYTHFGQSSVALFFMITGFLFFSKIIDGRTRNIDWGKLYVSRILRLGPLYCFLMVLVFLVIAYLSKGIVTEPLSKLVIEMVRWLGFTILGGPDINGVRNTFTIVAGVTWSLPYEWFFYFSLPLLALAIKVRVAPPYILLAAASVAGLAGITSLEIWHPRLQHAMAFLGGMAASFLVRSDRFRRFAVTKSSSLLAIGCVGAAVAAFPTADGFAPLMLLSLSFALIAAGNSLFGSLIHPVSRTLGEFAYSIYLLHGISLFVVFNFIVGIPESRALSPQLHWLLVLGLTPVLILICFLSFRLIEYPAMQQTTRLTVWLRSTLARGSLGLKRGGLPLR